MSVRRGCQLGLLGALLLALPVSAGGIYKCQTKGHITYQDRPCPATEAQLATLTPERGRPSASLQALRLQVAQLERNRKLRDLTAQRQELEQALASTQGAYRQALAELQQQRVVTVDERQSRDQRVAAAANLYEPRIRDLQEQLARVRTAVQETQTAAAAAERELPDDEAAPALGNEVAISK